MEASALKRASRRGLLARRSPFARLQKDEHLVAMVREGDSAAFETIVDRYQGRLLGFCRQMLRSNEDAEDVLQEVFVNAYKAMVADNREIHLRPWLYRIARNRCLNHLRKPTADAKESMDMVPMADEASTAERVHNREEFRQLLDDVGKLPETQRTALLLREMDALSYEEIAETMDTTVPSVKSLLVRARMSLSEASEARLLSCEEVRVSLAEAAEGISKVSGSVRKHIRGCEECERFRKQIRTDSRALATIFPAGPLIALKATLLGHLSGLLGGGSGASAGGGAAAGSAGASATAVGAGSTAAGAATAASAGATAAGAAAVGAGGGAMGGALGAKAVAGVMTAAVITAGAVEVNKGKNVDPIPGNESAVVRQVDDPSPKGPAILPAVSHEEERTQPIDLHKSRRDEAESDSEQSATEPDPYEADGTSEDESLVVDESSSADGADETTDESSSQPDKSESTAATGTGSAAERRGINGAVVNNPDSDVVTSPADHDDGAAVEELDGDEVAIEDDRSSEGPVSDDSKSKPPVEKPTKNEPPADEGSVSGEDPPVENPPADPPVENPPADDPVDEVPSDETSGEGVIEESGDAENSENGEDPQA